MSKKIELSYTYPNERFPSFFKDNFLSERESLQIQFFSQLKKVYLNDDYPYFYHQITPLLEKIVKIYGFSLENREFLMEVMLTMALETAQTSSTERIIILSSLNNIEKGKKRIKKLKINWKAWDEFFKKHYLTNDRLGYVSPHQMSSLYNILNKSIRRTRRLFENNSLWEVLDIYKEKGHPYEKFGGLVIFELFGKFHRKISPEKYEELLLEFIRIANYLDPMYLEIVAKIIRIHKSLKWHIYYDELFSIFLNFVESLLPAANRSSKYNSFFANSSLSFSLHLKPPIVVIPDILVNLLVPAKNQYHNKVWEYCERLFSLLDDFVHPQNEGKWTGTILTFYSIFTSRYIARYNQEQNIIKKHSKTKENKEKEEEDELLLEHSLEDDEKAKTDEDDDNEENMAEHLSESESSSSESIEDHNTKIHDFDYFLDEICHQKFIEVMRPIIKYLVFLRETREGAIINICLKLCYFKPNEIIPMLLKTIYTAFENPEMTFSTIYKILLIVIKPLLTRSVYKQGLYEIPTILRKSNENILASNWRQTYLVIKLYHRIFSLIPLFDLEDLEENFNKFCPNQPIENLKNELNKDEEIDMWNFTEELADLALEYFKKIFSILEFLEKPKNKDNRILRTLFINQHNKFWSFFFQSSNKLFKQYLNIIRDNIEDKIQIKAQEYYTYFLHCCSLKEPKLTLNAIFPVIFQKLIRKRKNIDNSDKFKNKSMLFLLEKSNIKDKILFYEPETLNKECQLWYLNLLEDVLTFGREYIKDHEENIEILLIHYFFSEDLSVYEKTLNILQKILLSLTGIYPLDLSAFNESEYKTAEFSLYFYKKIGESKSSSFEIKWHESSILEREYANFWVKRTLISVIDLIEKTFLNSIKEKKFTNLEDNFSEIIDVVNLSIKEPIQSLKQDFLRLLMMIEQVYGAIMMRCEQKTAVKDENYEGFKKNFLFDEFSELNMRLLELLEKIFMYLIDSELIIDVQIMGIYVRIIAQILGEDQYNDKMLSLSRWIKSELRLYKSPLTPRQGDIRLLRVLSITLDLYARIYSYSFILELSDKYAFIQYILIILAFHPFDTISKIAVPDLLEKTIIFIKKNQENSEKIIGNLLDFISKRLEGEIKGKEIISKNNIQAYLTVLIGGFERIIGIYEIKSKSVYLPKLLRVFNSYENIDNQNLQSKLFEIFVLKFFYLFENNSVHKKFNEKNKLKNSILIGKSPEFLEWEKEKPLKTIVENLENPYFLEIINIVNQKLSDEKAHWKSKIIYGLIGVALSSSFDPESSNFQNLLIGLTKGINNEHQFLRHMCRPGLLKIMKLIKKTNIEEKTENKIDKESFKNEQKNVDQFLETRFIRNSDYENCFINDNFLGSFEFYSEFEQRNKWKNISEIEKNANLSNLREFLSNKEFCKKFLDNCALDISVIHDTAGQQMPSTNFLLVSSRFINEIQTFSNSLFNKNRKKANNLKQFEIPNEFYVRLLQKFFQFGGNVFYENTIETIISFASFLNTKEKQIIVACYVNAFFKTMHIWHLNKEDFNQKQSILMEKVILPCLEGCSLENYQTWIFNLYNVCYYRDFREISNIFSNILSFLWSKSQNNPIKMQRYISLTRLICSNYGFRARNFAFEAINKIIFENEPTDLKQIAESSQFLADVTRWTFLVPINYKKIKEYNFVIDIDKRENEFYKDDSDIWYEKNEKLKKAFEFLGGKMNKIEEEKQKNYLTLITGMMSKVLKKRINGILFEYMRPFFEYHLEFKDEDIRDNSLLKTLNENIPYLARLRYSKELLQIIMALFEKSCKNESWRVRMRGLTFYHHFIFNNFFYLSLDCLVNPLKRAIIDENTSAAGLAMNILSDLLKLASKTEISDFIEKNLFFAKKPEKSEEKTIAIYSLMCLLLAFPNEIYTWTESVLEIVLKNKKITKKGEDKIKEFCSKFWKNRSVFTQLSEVRLSEEILQSLTEIANPYNYFA